jgi:hypothetical protein
LKFEYRGGPNIAESFLSKNFGHIGKFGNIPPPVNYRLLYIPGQMSKILNYSKVKFDSELDILEQKILFILVFALDEPTEHKKVIREHRF